MTWLEAGRIALRALGANKLRTALTMLGIIIGVAAVIALMSIGRGAQVTITRQIQSLGSNLLFIRPGASATSVVRGPTAATLTYDDAVALADQSRFPTIVGVAPELTTFGQVLASGQNWNTRIVGTTPDFEEVRNFRVANGEFFTRQQLDGRSTVAVLGAAVARNLFGDADPVGQTIRINPFGNRAGVNFRVIGVMEEKGASAFGNLDDQVLVPITTMQSRLFAQRSAAGGLNVSTIYVELASEDAVQEAVEQISAALRERHRVVQDDFTIQSQQDFLNAFNQITGTFTLLLGSIAGISLVVGGIGIMNIMLVSVTERTREIGIRKAVGARRSDILAQFLVESVVVSVAGGLIGILVGSGVASLLGNVPVQGSAPGQTLQTVVAPDSVLLAFGVSAAVGLFFGIYPATRAARLNPIEALRYE